MKVSTVFIYIVVCIHQPFIKNFLSLVLQIFIYSEAFIYLKREITSDWLQCTVYPIRNYVTFKFMKFWRKIKRMFLRMVKYKTGFQ